MDTENSRFDHLLDSLKKDKVNIITGSNGTGKSRFLAYAADRLLNEGSHSGSSFKQLLCLSGTHNDKFPRKIWQSNQKESKVCYLGYKVANNMISDIAPFRVIADHLLDRFSAEQQAPAGLDFCLEKLNIDSEIKLHFRYGKNRKASLSGFVAKEVSLDFREPAHGVDSSAISAALQERDLSLQTISIRRKGSFYTLSDLSSGERAYILALLGSLYCAQHKSLIFFDEPENSLHPAWQKSILRDLRKTIALNEIDTTILVATHSPLIAGSISNQDAYTCNFPEGQRWQSSDLHGKTTDSMLKDQFNLYSSRSTVVIELTQKCLSYIAKGELTSPSLYDAIDSLLALGLAPERGDPMLDILHTLEYLREHHELP